MDKKMGFHYTVVLIVLALIVFLAIKYTGGGMEKEDNTVAPIATLGEFETYTDPTTGIAYDFPSVLDAKYIEVADWPPKLQIVTQPFSCTEAGSPTDRAGETRPVSYGGNTYCVTKITEGAAGSVYSLYAYAIGTESATAILTFSLRATQCGNLGEGEVLNCEAELAGFDITPVIHDMFSSMRR
jgi:hypothetical protein